MVLAQSVGNALPDSIYGLDASLINGETYQYPYYQVTGHPYFMQNQFTQEEVCTQGVIFAPVALKLDVLNNGLLLEYENPHGALQQILLVDSLVQWFTINSKRFAPHEVPKKGVKFVQILNEGEATCFYYWTKEMKVSNSSGATDYKINREKRTQYIHFNGKIHRYKGKGSFLKIFPPTHKETIKTYLKTHKVKWKKASDAEVTQVMNYLNQLLP